jgi:hypothetical protein
MEKRRFPHVPQGAAQLLLLLLQDQIVFDQLHAIDMLGDMDRAGFAVGRIDKAAELNDALHGFDMDLEDAKLFVGDDIGADLVGDAGVIEVVAGLFMPFDHAASVEAENGET